MKNQKWIILAVALILIAGTAGALSWLRTHQKLGRPGLKTEPIPGGVMKKINLPERVLDFTSTNVPETEGCFGFSAAGHELCGTPLYRAGRLPGSEHDYLDGHRPHQHSQAGLLPARPGLGHQRQIGGEHPGGGHAELSTAGRQMGSQQFLSDRPTGRSKQVGGIYVFWLVADGEETPDNYQRMWWQARDLLRTGVLQRWAYVSYFSVCAPGQEEATFERMKNFIAHCRAGISISAGRTLNGKDVNHVATRPSDPDPVSPVGRCLLFASSFWMAYVLRLDPQIAAWLHRPADIGRRRFGHPETRLALGRADSRRAAHPGIAKFLQPPRALARAGQSSGR